MQSTTANNTLHNLAVSPLTSPIHTHLVAVPCANSAVLYGLNATTHTFNHLFRSTPSRGLVICSGTLFHPSATPDAPLLGLENLIPLRSMLFLFFVFRFRLLFLKRLVCGAARVLYVHVVVVHPARDELYYTALTRAHRAARFDHRCAASDGHRLVGPPAAASRP